GRRDHVALGSTSRHHLPVGLWPSRVPGPDVMCLPNQDLADLLSCGFEWAVVAAANGVEDVVRLFIERLLERSSLGRFDESNHLDEARLSLSLGFAGLPLLI